MQETVRTTELQTITSGAYRTIDRLQCAAQHVACRFADVKAHEGTYDGSHSTEAVW